MRRGSILTMAVIGAIAFIGVASFALFIPWLPEQASEEREGIDFVFWLATWICISVFTVVAAVIGYSVLKFRARPDDDSDGPPIHGHTGLEIAWTAVPALLVIVLGVASAIVLLQNDKARGGNPNRVEVTAQQFAWTFKYPNGAVSGTLRIPVGRSTVLEMQALDVIHSFFVPEWGQKRDVVPGTVQKLVITPKRAGEFQLECTELCGLGHALMRTKAIAMEQAAYERWLREGEQREATPAALFDEAGCAGCHAFEPAGSTAEVGPPLDEVGARGADFVRQSIVEPDADVAEGYSADVMPEDFGERLSDEQLDTLVQYLVEGGE